MSVIVGQHQEGITLNDIDWLLDAPEPDGEVMEFESKAKAEAFLREKGFTDAQMEWLVFRDTETKESL